MRCLEFKSLVESGLLPILATTGTATGHTRTWISKDRDCNLPQLVAVSCTSAKDQSLLVATGPFTTGCNWPRTSCNCTLLLFWFHTYKDFIIRAMVKYITVSIYENPKCCKSASMWACWCAGVCASGWAGMCAYSQMCVQVCLLTSMSASASRRPHGGYPCWTSSCCLGPACARGRGRGCCSPGAAGAAGSPFIAVWQLSSTSTICGAKKIVNEFGKAGKWRGTHDDELSVGEV